MHSPACPSCGYDLRAQNTESGARCPECGGAYSAEQLAPRNFTQRHIAPYWARWKWLLLAAVFVPAVIQVAGAWYGFERWYIRTPDWYNALGQSFMLASGLAHFVIGLVSGRRMPRPWPWWACLGVSVLLSVATVAAFYIFVFIVIFTLF